MRHTKKGECLPQNITKERNQSIKLDPKEARTILDLIKALNQLLK